MKKTLVTSALSLACVMSLPAAQAACNWTGQRAGLIGSGAVVGTLVAGPVGTVIGSALGDWLNGSTGKCQAPEKVVSAPKKVVPVNPYANLKPFDTHGKTSVYFAIGSNTLTSSDQSLLADAANVLKVHPNFNLTVVGATDPRAKNGYDNLALSQRRANTVKDYLVTKEGIDVNRVSTKGVGVFKHSEGAALNTLRVARLKLVEKKTPTTL